MGTYSVSCNQILTTYNQNTCENGNKQSHIKMINAWFLFDCKYAWSLKKEKKIENEKRQLSIFAKK